MPKGDTYKYTTFTLAVVLAVVITAFLSYNLGYNNGKGSNANSYTSSVTSTTYTTVLNTTSSTSMNHTTIAGNNTKLECYGEFPYAQVYAGNSISCGPFQLILLNTSTNVSGFNDVAVRLIYNKKIFVNVTDIGGGNEPRFNVSGTTLAVWVAGVSASPPYAYIGLSINGYIPSLTVETTITKTSTTSTTQTSTSIRIPCTTTITTTV